jgi:hypothetical protein
VAAGERGSHESMPLAMLGWFSGCSTIWSALFLVGSLLYGRTGQAAVLAVVFAASIVALAWVMRRLWPT